MSSASSMLRFLKLFFAGLLSATLAACGGGEAHHGTLTASIRFVGGLTPAYTGLMLSAAGHSVTVPAGATSFTFPERFPEETPYFVQVVVQPTAVPVPGQVVPTLRCTVPQPSGLVIDDVTVAVECETLFPFEAGVSGLTSDGLQIALGRGDIAVVPAGAVETAFLNRYPYGAQYSAGIVQQPGGNRCTIDNPSGTFLPPLDASAPAFLRVTCVPL